MKITDEMVQAALRAKQEYHETPVPSRSWRADVTAREEVVAILSASLSAALSAVEPGEEPVAEVLWHDPATDITPAKPGKIIDASIAFMDDAPIGAKLYSAATITALQDRLAEVEKERDAALEGRWEEWADEIRKILMIYGVDPGDEWDLPEQFEMCVAGVVEKETARAQAAEARIQVLDAALGSLVRLTKFELGDNASRQPWARVVAECDAALSNGDD